MKKLKLLLVIAALLPVFFACQRQHDTGSGKESTANAEKPMELLAFGSCSKEKDPDQLWPVIEKHAPDLWVWLGDAQYVSSYELAPMRVGFDAQKNHPQYSSFIGKTAVVGTWDDHDYGVNDAGGEHPNKAEMESLFLDFLDVPQNADVRNYEGVYQSFTYGPEGKQLKLILLDSRYFRDSLIKNPEEGLPRYLPNVTGDILGEAQWEWLEKELYNSTAQVHLIGSSIQLISSEHGWEKWANFPKAQQRFYDLLEKTKPANAHILSGDRHIAEFSAIQLPNLPKPLFDITSSGLTHTWSDAWEEQNQYRQGDMMIAKNFGLIRFDWESATMTVEIISDKNEVLGQQVIEID